MKITTAGIDVAKNLLQVHGVDERGKVVLRKQLRRHQVLPFFGLAQRHSASGMIEMTQLTRN
jgi:transposase